LVSRVAVLPNGGPAVDVRHHDRRTALLARYTDRYGRVIRGNGQMPDTAGQPETTHVIPKSRSSFLVNRELLIATGTRPRALWAIECACRASTFMKTRTRHGHCGHGTDRSHAHDQRSGAWSVEPRASLVKENAFGAVAACAILPPSGPCRVRSVRAVSVSSWT